ncbi:dehydrogenase/reductase SDR family member 13-like [Cylas formicarius]|uniref:dehydrogenase/reductase SDR family member 13-like n=1 Tax=Cylas formicarius TaxID=197179 RepID=UPI0029584FB4|nr:dehydrogenase/reductase SDR family member 13-like [Cylas formicarius]
MIVILKIVAGLAAVLFCVKLYVVHTTKRCTNCVSLIGKTVVVTGANTGIGFQSALEFAKRGARVILACRNQEKADIAREEIVQRTQNTNVEVKIVDFSSLASVEKCAKDISDSEARVDILVNNAGVGGTRNKSTDDGLQILMQINYFGPFLFTILLLDRLKQAPNARIINVSSILAKEGKIDVTNLNSYAGQIATYSNSKLCNIFFTTELARRLKDTNVSAFSLHPGAIRTEIFRRVKGVRKLILDAVSALYFKSPEEGAQTIIYTATEQGLEKYSGRHFEECAVVPGYPSALDHDLATSVWKRTCDILDVDGDVTDNQENGFVKA